MSSYETSLGVCVSDFAGKELNTSLLELLMSYTEPSESKQELLKLQRGTGKREDGPLPNTQQRGEACGKRSTTLPEARAEFQTRGRASASQLSGAEL